MILWSIAFVILMISNENIAQRERVKNSSEICPNVKSDFSVVRKKRHLTFPDGTMFLMTISLVKAIMVHAPSGWNVGLETDVLFPMPDANYTNAYFRKKKLHHRQKREFWQRLEDALELQNINGKSCVLRSICEAQTYLAPPGQSLVHDILRAIFTVPQHQEFKEEIQGSYYELLDSNFCQNNIDCPFSLINFITVFNKRK